MFSSTDFSSDFIQLIGEFFKVLDLSF